MAWYPGAVREKITANKGRKKMAVYNRVNLHVAVSEADSLFGYFNQPGIPDSHFYILKNGIVKQMVDTKYRAFADLEGNDATISIETQGNDKGKWTKKQRKAIAEVVAWVHKVHGVPLKLATDSKLGGSSKGLSWHRLGIDGNFPQSGILRGRLQRGGGMLYSTAYGKTCPGDAKIKQIPGILKAAKGATPASKPKKPKRKKPVTKPKKHAKIEVDGIWGADTTGLMQSVLGTPRDREVWSQNIQWKAGNPGLTSGWKWVATRNAKGSAVIRAHQRVLKKRGYYKGKIDGIAGPQYFGAIQADVGTPVDREIWLPSRAVKKLQKRLNKGKI